MLRVLGYRIDSPLSDRKLFAAKLFIDLQMKVGKRSLPLHIGYVTGNGHFHRVMPVHAVADFTCEVHALPEMGGTAKDLRVSIEIQHHKTGHTTLFPIETKVVVGRTIMEQTR